MLKDLNTDQARFIALLARTARQQRDALLGKVAETDLNGPQAARGEHNPTAALGYEGLPDADPQAAAMREAVASLSKAARMELYTLMRLGQGDMASKQWHRGLSEAELLGDATIAAAIIENPDLHDHITKGLYEAGLVP